MLKRFILTLALTACGTAAHAANHTTDSLDKVQQKLAENKAVLIDVRELDEWKRGHLDQASLVPLSELRKAAKDPALQEQLAPRLPKDRIIYCHCASGIRVLTAADILGKLGYDIRPLAASYSDLIEAGFPAAPPE